MVIIVVRFRVKLLIHENPVCMNACDQVYNKCIDYFHLQSLAEMTRFEHSFGGFVTPENRRC